MSFSLVDLWASTGVFARGVIVTMLLMSLVSVFVFCERLVVFIRSRRASQRYAEKVASSLGAGELKSAATHGVDPGYLGRVIEAGIKAFSSSPTSDEQFTVETVARALERQAQREIQQLRRGQRVLGTVSSTAPFVGLLGTVIGIVTAFEHMAESGSPSALAPWTGEGAPGSRFPARQGRGRTILRR